MEKLFLEKLSEIANILIVSHQKIEKLQKILFITLKKAGKLPGLENVDNTKNSNEILR